MHCSNFQHLTEEELALTVEADARKALNDGIRERLGGPVCKKDLDPTTDLDMITPIYDLYMDDNGDGFVQQIKAKYDPNEESGIDKYMGAKVILPHNDRETIRKVKERAQEQNGTFDGRANPNPMLDIGIGTGQPWFTGYNRLRNHITLT